MKQAITAKITTAIKITTIGELNKSNTPKNLNLKTPINYFL
jgi:hypothetical protein